MSWKWRPRIHLHREDPDRGTAAFPDSRRDVVDIGSSTRLALVYFLRPGNQGLHMSSKLRSTILPQARKSRSSHVFRIPIDNWVVGQRRRLLRRAPGAAPKPEALSQALAPGSTNSINDTNGFRRDNYEIWCFRKMTTNWTHHGEIHKKGKRRSSFFAEI
jgi:hypothetical protein